MAICLGPTRFCVGSEKVVWALVCLSGLVNGTGGTGGIEGGDRSGHVSGGRETLAG